MSPVVVNSRPIRVILARRPRTLALYLGRRVEHHRGQQRAFSSRNPLGQGRKAMSSGATVFIVDDAQESRMGLSRLLAAAGYQVRAFESAGRFLVEQDAETPGCLLLVVCLQDLSGIELQRALEGSPYAHPIVFLTAKADICTAVQAMKSGAVDFLEKPIEDERLIAAVEQALRRDTEQREERITGSRIQHRLQRLTARERQVMDHIVRGLLNKQIAADLSIVEKTVKVHRERVMKKTRTRSVPELVQLAVRAGLTSPLVLRDGGAALLRARADVHR